MSARTRLRKLARGLVAALLLGSGLIAGVTWRHPQARADVRRTPPEQHFKSGAQRSEAILREMSATLKSIDTRLQRLEQLAEKQLGKPQPVVRERPR